MSTLRKVLVMLDAVGHEICTVDFRGARARESWKASISVMLAIGITLSTMNIEDGYWATFAAFMVTRPSAAETVTRGSMRWFGTVGGCAAGFLVAPWTSNHPFLLIAAFFIIGWVGLFHALVSRYNYAWMFFGMTAMLALTISLAKPAVVIPFVAIRVAEIFIGVVSAMVVAAVFELFWTGPPEPPLPPADLPIWRSGLSEEWLEKNWNYILHATRGALALALLPFVWRLLELGDLAGTAVTSFMVMVVPAAAVRQAKESAIEDRGWHRALGCLCGGSLAILFLLFIKDSVFLWVICLVFGVWAAAWIQNGTSGIPYLGAQIALGFMVTFVQGAGAPTLILPALERLEGIAIGVAVLSAVNYVWRLPEPKKP